MVEKYTHWAKLVYKKLAGCVKILRECLLGEAKHLSVAEMFSMENEIPKMLIPFDKSVGMVNLNILRLTKMIGEQ